MKGERSWVFGSGNRTRRNKDRRREGERCLELANSKVCKGYSKVLGIGKLLSSIYSELCIYSQTIV